MKKFIALAAVVLVSMATTTMYAQESRAEKRADRKAQRDAERARLKAEEQAQDAISYDDAMAALKAHQFVMEADQVMFRNGQTAFVNSNTNFVLVNQGRGTVQVAFNTVYPGPNGIGGVTVDGTVSDIQMTTDKRGNVNCNFSIQGIGISAQIFLTLTDGGNNATVTISPNFNSNTMTLSGNLVPLEQSNIFKGGYHLVYTERGRLAAFDGAVEQRSVNQCAFVVALHLVGGFGIAAHVSFRDNFVLKSAGQRNNSLAFFVLFQELFAGFYVCCVHLLLQFGEVLVDDVTGFCVADCRLVALQNVFDCLCKVIYCNAFGTHA